VEVLHRFSTLLATSHFSWWTPVFGNPTILDVFRHFSSSRVQRVSNSGRSKRLNSALSPPRFYPSSDALTIAMTRWWVPASIPYSLGESDNESIGALPIVSPTQRMTCGIGHRGCFKSLGGHAQVRPSGRKVGVPEQRLDLGKAGPLVHGQRGIGVSETVSERPSGATSQRGLAGQGP
jgi:hypothetical protein